MSILRVIIMTTRGFGYVYNLDNQSLKSCRVVFHCQISISKYRIKQLTLSSFTMSVYEKLQRTEAITIII